MDAKITVVKSSVGVEEDYLFCTDVSYAYAALHKLLSSLAALPATRVDGFTFTNEITGEWLRFAVKVPQIVWVDASSVVEEE